MPRIPYVPHDLDEPRELVQAIRQRRGGQLIELDRLLLHSPPLAEGWNFHLGQVRNKLSISPKLRELAMCVVAVVNRAHYEYDGHLPLFIRHGGTPEQGAAILDVERAARDEAMFDATERATIRLSCEMTRDAQVDEQTFRNAQQALGGSTRLITELVGVIATYNMVSRFLVAMDLHGA